MRGPGIGLSVKCNPAARRSGTGTPTPTPTPAPSFTTQPSISPSSGNVGNTFTASDGVASNSTGLTRRWLLGVTQIGTGTTVVPVTTGSLTLEVTATGPGGSTVATSAAVTVSAGTMPNYRVALANAKNGTSGPLIINVIGDSTIAGSGAGTGTPATLIANNPRAGAINQQLATAFAGSGLAKNGADIFAFNFPINTQTAADYALWNTSVTVGAWAYNPGLITLGGNMWNIQASGANFSWTGEGRQFDRLVVYYLEFGSGGTFKVKIDGTSQGNINSVNATASIKKVIYTPTLNTHTVEWEWVSGSIYILGMETLDTTNKASVRVRNLGQGSASSTDLIDNATAWRARYMLQALEAASLHVIEGGLINDWVQGVIPSTTGSNLGIMMTAAQTNGGDVLLLGPTRSNTASYSDATQQATVDAMSALANGTTKAFYDLATGTGGVGKYATMSAAVRMFDNLHPNLSGYAAEAAALYGAIT